MQAVARRHIDINSELVFQQKLDADQLKQGELALRIVVNKQIEIASRFRLIACDGAEQIERRGAQRLNGLGVMFELCNCLLLVHLGDFFEAFEEDARILARVCGITLTSKEFGKGDRVPLSGIPITRLDHYLLNEIEGLENPTSEMVAQWLWNQVAPLVPGLYCITIEETCTTRCRYFG